MRFVLQKTAFHDVDAAVGETFNNSSDNRISKLRIHEITAVAQCTVQ